MLACKVVPFLFSHQASLILMPGNWFICYLENVNSSTVVLCDEVMVKEGISRCRMPEFDSQTLLRYLTLINHIKYLNIGFLICKEST